MFKYKIGQIVWFLVGPMGEDEDPEYLEGFITRQYVDDDHHGSPDALYEIQAGDDLYDREESDLYASFDELSTAIVEFLRCCLSMPAQAKGDFEIEDEEAADRERREYLDWTHGKKSGYGPDSFMCYMSDYD